jgi:nucleotide-binding universal stress UspA family protein
MYQDLLLATDGSDAASRATDHAIELANRLDATLHVLSVSEDGPQATEKQDRMRSDPESEAATSAELAA